MDTRGRKPSKRIVSHRITLAHGPWSCAFAAVVKLMCERVGAGMKIVGPTYLGVLTLDVQGLFRLSWAHLYVRHVSVISAGICQIALGSCRQSTEGKKICKVNRKVSIRTEYFCSNINQAREMGHGQANSQKKKRNESASSEACHSRIERVSEKK